MPPDPWVYSEFMLAPRLTSPGCVASCVVPAGVGSAPSAWPELVSPVGNWKQLVKGKKASQVEKFCKMATFWMPTPCCPVINANQQHVLIG